MIFAYAMIGAFVGMLSSAFAFFALDTTFLTALGIYALVGSAAMATVAVAVALRPERVRPEPKGDAPVWAKEEAA